MNIENNSDLIEFINKEKLNYSALNHNKVFRYFTRCLIKTIKDINEKFMDKNSEIDFKNGVIMGTNMLFHVFWILITYTNNIKLTIFLTERAILLFTEFILMSKEPNIKEDLCYSPNITDAISFAYKKTIGALKTSELLVSSSTQIIYLKESALAMKMFLQECYLNYYNDDSLEEELEKINTNFRALLFKIYYNSNNHYIYEKITNLIYHLNNYKKFIIFMKVYLDLFLHVINKKINVKKLHLIFDNAYDKFKNFDINENINIADYKKSILFNDMKKNVYYQLNN